MEAIPSYIKEEGLYLPKTPDNPWGMVPDELRFVFHTSKQPLKYLIENGHVFQDENKDWVLVRYSWGATNTEDYFHWEKTGYQRLWKIWKWDPNVDLDQSDTYYYVRPSGRGGSHHFKVRLNNHYYHRVTHPNGYWVETVERGLNQLYYKNSMGLCEGKFPVKIGKKVQELRDKGIEFGYYKF
jgi:hypothetical protein